MDMKNRAAYSELLRQLTTGNGDKYELGKEIWSLSMDLADSSDWIYYPSWLVWGSLTDWVENKPEQRNEAENAMLRAAKEFLALNGDLASEQVYFDRWVYDECGYERPTDNNQALAT